MNLLAGEVKKIAVLNSFLYYTFCSSRFYQKRFSVQVCKHLSKLFDSLAKLEFREDSKKAFKMVSKDSEEMIMDEVCLTLGFISYSYRTLDKITIFFILHFNKLLGANERSYVALIFFIFLNHFYVRFDF